MKWSREQRLRFIEQHLISVGHIRRADVVQNFDVSIPQASLDFSEYQRSFPANMEYDRRAKLYRRTRAFKPFFSETGEIKVGLSPKGLEEYLDMRPNAIAKLARIDLDKWCEWKLCEPEALGGIIKNALSGGLPLLCETNTAHP